ncbi:DUF3817 domain-containing protein, partial [Streptomyces sp. NPDC059873]
GCIPVASFFVEPKITREARPLVTDREPATAKA